MVSFLDWSDSETGDCVKNSANSGLYIPSLFRYMVSAVYAYGKAAWLTKWLNECWLIHLELLGLWIFACLAPSNGYKLIYSQGVRDRRLDGRSYRSKHEIIVWTLYNSEKAVAFRRPVYRTAMSDSYLFIIVFYVANAYLSHITSVRYRLVSNVWLQ